MIPNVKLSLIKFHYQAPRFHFSHRTIIKEVLFYLFEKEKSLVASMNYIFCTDEYLLKINQDYLQHNDLTDIITFDLSDKESGVIGEVYISVDRVRENASIFKKSFQEELVRVIFHGALHLCGYTDKTAKAKVVMRAKEDQYIEHYNLRVPNVPRGTNLA